MSLSGTHLEAFVSDRSYSFDNTNEVLLSGLYHVMVISGGTGYPAGRYRSVAVFAGPPKLHHLNDNTGTLIAPDVGANGATWSMFFGRLDGDGTFGTNLVTHDTAGTAGYCYDPDSPMTEAIIGKTITVSGGTGLPAGDYGVAGYIGASLPPVFLVVDLTSSHAPQVSANNGDGITWAVTGGVDRPAAPTPNTDYTGAVKVAIVGDSLPNLSTADGTVTAEITAAYPNAASITVTNCAVIGALADDYAQGGSHYSSTVSAINSAGSTIVVAQLGTNASASTAAWLTAMQSFVSGIFGGDCPTVTDILIPEIPYAMPGGVWDDAKIQAYNAVRSSVGNGSTAGASGAHSFFQSDTPLLTDQVHPAAPYGRQAMVRMWLTGGLMEAIAPTAAPPTTAPMLLLGVG